MTKTFKEKKTTQIHIYSSFLEYNSENLSSTSYHMIYSRLMHSLIFTTKYSFINKTILFFNGSIIIITHTGIYAVFPFCSLLFLMHIALIVLQPFL